MARAVALDHVVLLVADARRSAAWYRDVLGLEVLREAAWEAGEAPFLSLRIDAGTIVDLFEQAPEGVNVDHLCLVVDDLDAVLAHPSAAPEGAPARLWGARGWGRAAYLRDPDGHRIEVRTYEGVEQG